MGANEKGVMGPAPLATKETVVMLRNLAIAYTIVAYTFGLQDPRTAGAAHLLATYLGGVFGDIDLAKIVVKEQEEVARNRKGDEMEV